MSNFHNEANEIMDNIDEGLKNIQRAGELREEQIEVLRVWAETRIENCQKENTRLQASVTALEYHLEHGDMDGETCLLNKCAYHYQEQLPLPSPTEDGRFITTIEQLRWFFQTPESNNLYLVVDFGARIFISGHDNDIELVGSVFDNDDNLFTAIFADLKIPVHLT